MPTIGPTKIKIVPNNPVSQLAIFTTVAKIPPSAPPKTKRIITCNNATATSASGPEHIHKIAFAVLEIYFVKTLSAS